MAMVQLGRGSYDDGNDDPRNFVAPAIGPAVGDTTVRVPEPFDLRAEYRNLLGRDPDAGELATEPENVGKYGIEQLRSNLRGRAVNDPYAGGGGARGLAGDQFDDAYSKQLEGIAKAQMGEVRSNPGLDKLMSFLNSQFTELSTNPGYRPDELAVMNTQLFEPIEERRQADQRRVLERTAARGFLPSSGLTEDLAQQVDLGADKQRTVAGRDLAIKSIDQRRNDLSRALELGQMLGLDIPRSQRSEELNLSTLLYNMPRQALQDLLSVLNGSPSSTDLLSGSIAAQNSNLFAQQQADQRNAALMEQIGSMLGTLFGGR